LNKIVVACSIYTQQKTTNLSQIITVYFNDCASVSVCMILESLPRFRHWTALGTAAHRSPDEPSTEIIDSQLKHQTATIGNSNSAESVALST